MDGTNPLNKDLSCARSLLKGEGEVPEGLDLITNTVE